MPVVKEIYFRDRPEPLVTLKVGGNRKLIFEEENTILEGGIRVPKEGIFVRTVAEDTVRVSMLHEGHEFSFNLEGPEINSPSAPALESKPGRFGFHSKIRFEERRQKPQIAIEDPLP